MSTAINEISKVFLHGETLESSELNAIISQINTTIRKLNGVESNLDNHVYDVSIPITNIYCRTKKGINAINFFPQADAKRDELLERVSNCSITLGIKYNTTFSTVTLSENADIMNGVWTSYPLGVNESLPHEWEVSYKKLEDNSIMYMFGPVLRSNYGYNGADGDSVLYVYRVFDHELSDSERVNNTPTRPTNPDSNGEFIPSGWTDDPLGPTASYPYEYIATLKKIGGNWGLFEKISLWSTYTEDGANGDFQTRAFCRFVPTSSKSAPNKPIGGTYENPLPGSNDNIQWSLTVPAGSGPLWTSTRIFKGTGETTEWSVPSIEVDTSELDIEYSSNSERPSGNTLRDVPGQPHPSTGIWHDPTEKNIDLSAMIWRAERKIKNGLYDGKWVITRMKGERGSFKSIVFRRFKPSIQQLIPATPTGGTYNNPIPDGYLWSDGIPAGDSKTDGPIWASVRTFYDDGTVEDWSEPKILADSENLDIEFSPNEIQPDNPTGEPFSNRQASGWYDPSAPNFDSIGPMIWRAERRVENNRYVGDWTVTRIYGEKGDPGFNGDFTSRVFCRSLTQPETPIGGNYDDPTPDNRDAHGVLIWSDGVPTTGPGKIWTSYRKFYGDTEHAQSEWSVPTIEADSNTLDIEYSDSPTEPDPNTLRDNPKGNHPSNNMGVNWYDPSKVPEGVTVIWRAERKISGTIYDGPWTISRILGERGAQGYRGDFVSRVFRRSSEDLGKEEFIPTGGSYDTPVPSGWSDGIPSSGSGKIWSSYRKFYGDPALERNNPDPWSIPTLESDSESLDIEYSDSQTQPGTGTLRSTPGGLHPLSNVHWYDPSDSAIQGKTIIWRAERKISGTEYDGEWVISRILGERGELGYRGDFVSRVFCRNSSKPSTPSGGDYDHPIPTNNDSNGNKIWSDGIPATGVGKIWSSTRKFYGLPGQTSNWSEPTLEADSESLDIEYSIDLLEPSKNSLRQKPGDPHPTGYGTTWYDPKDINTIPTDSSTGKKYPIIWRAERKISGDLYVGEWAITRIFGETGPTGKWGSFKSCVFKRSNGVLNKTISATNDHATYDNPIPSGNGDLEDWHDGIPEGNEILWMAVSKFSGNGDEHTNWTVTQLTDSVDLDVEFSPGSGDNKICPPVTADVFKHPINNYGVDGQTITTERLLRNNIGWWDASALPANQTMIWRAERKVHNLQYVGDWVITRIQGEKGEKGNDAELTATQQADLAEAGLRIVVTPQNIILDLSDVLDAEHLDRIDDVKATIVILSTSTGNGIALSKYRITEANIYANGISSALIPASGSYLTVKGDRDSLNEARSVEINNLPIEDYNYKYNKGHIEVKLEVVINSATVRTIKVDIPWYLNKLGERIKTLKGDLETTLMSKEVFNDNNNSVERQKLNGLIKTSAGGTVELYTKDKGLVKEDGTSNVPTLLEFGEYKRTASENVSKLGKTITGTNLIADTGWSKVFYYSSSVLGNSNSKTLCSPFMKLSPGKYIFSCYIPNSVVTGGSIPNLNFVVRLLGFSEKLDISNILYVENVSGTNYVKTKLSSEEYSNTIKIEKSGANGYLVADSETGDTGDYYTVNGVKYVRCYFAITISTDLYYTLFVLKLSSNSSPWSSLTTCLRPQLELCLDSNTTYMPTAWVPGPQDFSSEIKQTADSITSEIKGFKSGKNLLSGPLTNGASSSTSFGCSTSGNFTSNSSLKNTKLDSDGYIVTTNDYSYIFQSGITIEKGKYYTLSFNTKGVSLVNICVFNMSNGNIYSGEGCNTYCKPQSSSTKKTATFKVDGTGSETVAISIKCKAIKYPLLELGTEATPFDAGTTEVTSIIKQTADSITSKVEAVDGKVSQIKQETDSITSTVKGGNENLIMNGAFISGTSNWENWGSPTVREIVSIGGKKWMHIKSTTAQYEGFNQRHYTDYGITVKANTKYTISLRAKAVSGTPTVSVGFHWFTGNSNIVSQTWEDFAINTTENVYSAQLTVPANIDNFNVMVGDKTTSVQEFYITEIKLEIGEMATAWSDNHSDSYSEIKQTANEIDASVRDDLGEVGINIKGSTKSINLQADKVTFSDSQGGNTDKIAIDPATGTLIAMNAKITGGVFVDRVAFLGGRAYEPQAYVTEAWGKQVEYYFYDVTAGESYESLYGSEYNGYYGVGEITLKSNHLFIYTEGLGNYPGTQREFYDSVHDIYYYSTLRVVLPPPQFFVGQSIVITNQSYGFDSLSHQFINPRVSLEQAYWHLDYSGAEPKIICLTDRRFIQETHDYPYGTDTSHAINCAPYHISENGLVLLNGVWQTYDYTWQGYTKKGTKVLDVIDLEEYEWIEVTAVEGYQKDLWTIVPSYAADYNFMWIITRFERKAKGGYTGEVESNFESMTFDAGILTQVGTTLRSS